MDSENNIALIKDKIKGLIRQAAHSRACVHTREDKCLLVDIADQYRIGQVMGNWMSLILITGESVKITLKLHFSYQDIKKTVYPIYGVESPSDISDQQAMDFVKELSNLTAGYLEKSFEEMGVSLGISLPLGTRGFYEIFADYTPSSQPIIKFNDLWRIEHEDIKLIGTVMVEISNPETLSGVLAYDSSDIEEDDDEGEFDFL